MGIHILNYKLPALEQIREKLLPSFSEKNSLSAFKVLH